MVTQRGRHYARDVSAGRGGLRRRARAALTAEALRDGWPPGRAGVLTWLPAVGTLVLGAGYVLGHQVYYWLLLEDHPVEWAQFGLLVFAGVAAAAATVRLGRAGRAGLAVLLALAAAGCFGLAGEEISWGERAFSLGVPAGLAADNAQHELNVHNLIIGGITVDTVSDMVELALGLGGCALALLARPNRGPLRATWWSEVAPPLPVVPCLALAVLYQTAMLGTGASMAPAILYQEWEELCLYLAIAVTAACCFTRAAPARPLRSLARGPLGAPWGAGRRPLIAAAVAAAVLTAVLAQLSAQSTVLPGNVPPSLVWLYGAL
jgi:hypothetical protein